MVARVFKAARAGARLPPGAAGGRPGFQSPALWAAMAKLALVRHSDLLQQLGLDAGKPMPGTSDGKSWFGQGPARTVRTPIDGATVGAVRETTAKEYDQAVAALSKAFEAWRLVPAPKRGEVVRRWGVRLRELKEPLGRLVSVEDRKST